MRTTSNTAPRLGRMSKVLAAGTRHLALALVVFLAFAAASALPAAQAQEAAILDAINGGEVTGGSQLALPDPGSSRAMEAPGIGRTERYLASITREQERDIVDRAYPLMSSKWPFNVVYVCWEEPAADDYDKRALVRQVVSDTWEANSGLRFRGWNTCVDGSTGIRIAVADEGPHVKFLGKYLDGVPQGMVLNFTFEHWSLTCRATVDHCIRTIAVHEFGHAIGFAHEQNRPDTPGECFEPPQGSDGDNTKLTPWDPHSVMNYCNAVYNNDGMLSEFDILAAQYIYGAP